MHNEQLTIETTILLFPDINECLLGMDMCDHDCHDTQGSYTCSCRQGYTLDSDGYSCIGMYHYNNTIMVNNDADILFILDVNECLGVSTICDQNCHNTIGGYTCSCNTGYTLDRNGYTCNGIMPNML